MKYALFSLSDKTGALELASFLQEQGIKLLGTSSTSQYLRDAGLEVQNVSDFTGFPEILDGRVKTLHPKIHGSLLYLRDNEEHLAEKDRSNLVEIAVVVVNLYPFIQVSAQTQNHDEIIEKIDIGGPAMLRSAAKNYRNVATLCQFEDYQAFIEEWQENAGSISLKTRQILAGKVYSHTAHYDTYIANWFNQKNEVTNPDKLMIAGECKEILRYGENPHQTAAIYRTSDMGLVGAWTQLHGKQMSYNNYFDAEAALAVIDQFSEMAVAIIKHQNPCGAAIQQQVDDNLLAIYNRALACDSTSAFGGIVAFNREVDEVVAQVLAQRFYEIILAPSFTKEALNILQKKKNIRILHNPSALRQDNNPKWDVRSLSGGFAIQQSDATLSHTDSAAELAQFSCVTVQQPQKKDLEELLFAWKLASRVKSNAIVFTKDFASVGIGAGQMSRIDSVKIATQKAKEMGFDLKGSYVASDAFFPFRDAVDAIAEYGIKAIVQPGGSINDKESIAAANDHNLIMFFTGTRHFYH